MNIIHQLSHVFVFEDTNDPMGEKNGTLNLIFKLSIQQTISDTAVMHAIRKEFLKKVLVGYLKQIPVKKKEKEDAEFVPDHFEETIFSITTTQERKAVKEKVLNNLDQMEATMVFHLYQQLALELKEKLEKHGLIPDLIQKEQCRADGNQGVAHHAKEADNDFIKAIVRKLINFVASGNFLSNDYGRSQDDASNICINTTPEMSNFPRYILSTPWQKPFSEEFKNSIC